MRIVATVAILSLLPSLSLANKLTFEDRIELTRGLLAEYAKAKLTLPRSKKALEVNADGTINKQQWDFLEKTREPAARAGDLIQVTKIEIGEDKIVLEINGGQRSQSRWYDHVQVGLGNPAATTAGDANAPSGTSIALLFHKALEPIKSATIKKLLASVLDFDKHSATELYVDTLAPETKQAILEKRVTVGMTRDQVVLALGRPAHKSRETNDGIETEDWVFGMPPGKITFVTLNGDKVIKVKEEYAGLGTAVADPPVPR